MEKRFLQRFFACFLGLTLLFAGVVWVVDPWYHFHGPLAGLPLCLRNGRYQNDGAARHLDYDTLLIGTSVTANMYTRDLDRCTGGYTWGEEEGRVWSRASALAAYNRPEVLPDQEPAEAYLGAARDDLDKLLARVDAHPDVTFHFYMAPYRILFWDYTIRKGQLEATFAMQQLVLEELTGRENVQVLYLMDDLDRITNLDLYCDHIHYSPEVCRELVEEIVTGTPMTREEVEPRLAAFRAFVTSYDYESLFA